MQCCGEPLRPLTSSLAFGETRFHSSSSNEILPAFMLARICAGGGGAQKGERAGVRERAKAGKTHGSGMRGQSMHIPAAPCRRRSDQRDGSRLTGCTTARLMTTYRPQSHTAADLAARAPSSSMYRYDRLKGRRDGSVRSTVGVLVCACVLAAAWPRLCSPLEIFSPLSSRATAVPKSISLT